MLVPIERRVPDVLRAATLPSARIPTIVLVAQSDEADRIDGFDLGADDCVTKAFSPRELVARVPRSRSRARSKLLRSQRRRLGSPAHRDRVRDSRGASRSSR
jgi:DNA-binding response OmpR family regulator